MSELVKRYRDAQLDAPLSYKEAMNAMYDFKTYADMFADEIERLEKERDELRAIFPEICRAIGNGAGCTEQASVEFLREIPKEIAAVIGDLKARLAKYEGGGK